MNILELKDVSFSYYGKYRTVDVIKGVSYTLETGRVYGVVGKSGSGKTTLVSLIAGMMLPTGGDVLFEGKSTSEMDLDLYRRDKLSIVFQSFRLLPLLTVLENVTYPLELRHVERAKAEEIAREKLRRVGLGESYESSLPGMLSGGEQQRVAIARALTGESRLLIADEPTGNLDEENSRNTIDLLVKLAREEDYAVVIVTHDLDVLPKMDTVLKLSDGKLVEIK
ncbi:MAG: ABC transporter ATP-binding protein [Clostridia bacterium]|nr:ABC transporter ATP-binding protein [Clostridia bacterium]